MLRCGFVQASSELPWGRGGVVELLELMEAERCHTINTQIKVKVDFCFSFLAE